MLALNRRLTDFAQRHPWRFAGLEFTFLVMLSIALLFLLHRSFFSGLFGAVGVCFGQIIKSRTRQGRPMSAPYKLGIAAAWLISFFLLGAVLQVGGLLPR